VSIERPRHCGINSEQAAKGRSWTCTLPVEWAEKTCEFETRNKENVMNGQGVRLASALGATAAFGVCAAAMTVGCGGSSDFPGSAEEHDGLGVSVQPQTLKGPPVCTWGCDGDVNG